MKEGSYIIKVRIFEGSDIRPVEWNGSVQAFVVVRLFDQVKQTQVVKDTLSPLFDNSIIFEFNHLTKGQLESAKLVIELWDWNRFMPNELVGNHEIDLSTIYYQENHQFYRTWLTLIDPFDVREGVLGYINTSIDVLGPDDEPVIRESITAEDTQETVLSSKIKGEGHLIIAEVFRGEHIVPMKVATKKNRNYIRLNYGGSTVETFTNENDDVNPEWNEILYLQATLPNHSKNVQVELYNRNIASDDLIGTGLIPINLFKFLDDLPPTWINIYGPPLVGNGDTAKSMAIFGAKRGSCYRGRVLMRFSSRAHTDPKSYRMKMMSRMPEIALPTPPCKTYTLRCDIFNGQALPADSGLIHFSIGPYLIKSTKKTKVDGVITWEETLENNRIVLPVDPQMIPDLFVYFSDEDYESHRKCYLRIPARQILCRSKKQYDSGSFNSIIAKLKEDQSLDLVEDDQFSGFLTIRPIIFGITPPPKLEFSKIDADKKEYKLKLFLMVGRNFPSASNQNISNPFIVVTCAGKILCTKTIKNTLNPEWHQVLTTDINIPDVKNIMAPRPTLVIMVYHSVSGDDFTSDDLTNGKKKVLLGRYWLDLDVNAIKQFKLDSGSRDIIYKQPKWVPIIYDKRQEVEGKLLMSYALIPKESNEEIERYLTLKGINLNEVKTNRLTFDLRVFIVGIRDIINRVGMVKKPSWCSAEIKISLPSKCRELLVPTQKKEDVESEIDEDQPQWGIFKHSGKQKGPKEAGAEEQINNELVIDAHPEVNSTQEGDDLSSINTAKLSIKNNSIDIQRTFKIRVDAPYNKVICPVLEIFIFHYPFGRKELLGTGVYPLEKALGFFYGDEDDQTYQEKWKRFFKIKNTVNVNNPLKSKPVKLKLPKVSPENQLLYLDKLVYELPKAMDSKKTQKRLLWKAGNLFLATKLKLEKEGKLMLQNLQKMDDIENVDFPTRVIIENEDIDKLSEIEIEKLKACFAYLKIERSRSIYLNDIYHSIRTLMKFNPEFKRHIRREAEEKTLLSKSITNQVTFNMSNTQKQAREMLTNIMGGQDYKEALMNNSLDGVSEEHSDQLISGFSLKDDDEIESLKADVSEKALNYDQLFITEKVESNKNKQIQKTKQKSLYGGLSLFKNPFSFWGDTIEEYLDFDTDNDEIVETVPEYLKGREEFNDDLEDIMMTETKFRKVIETVKLFKGNKRIAEQDDDTAVRDIGVIKCLFLREDKKDLLPLPKVKKFLQDMLKNRGYVCRVYILKGVGLTPLGSDSEPKTYLRCRMNGRQMDTSDDPKKGFYPEYYHMFEFPDLELPGSGFLNIDVMSDGAFGDELVGSTEIDLEERIFNLEWVGLALKPVEKRNLILPGKGSRGRLEMWIELIRPGSLPPPIPIFPKEELMFELRVIVWETKNVVFKDEQEGCNDLYVRGKTKRSPEFKETDTHWRCRGTGSFNWRWKIPITLPIDQNKNYGEDKFIIQLWDRDLIGRNELIGEAEIDLNIHNMLKKAYARKNKSVDMRRRIKGSGQETKKLWFDVFHSEAVDEWDEPVSQGQVCLSFQCVPKSLIEKQENTEGRDNPNFHPTLPDPVGRFSFDLFSPLQMLKEILGPGLYFKICCCLWCSIFIFVFFAFGGFFFSSILASIVTSI